MFIHAPAPRLVDGLRAVPIHVLGLGATVTVDVVARRATVSALVRYEVGPTTGCPVFDLRQTIDAAWLDGRPIGADHLGNHDVGEGPYATVRVLDVVQVAGSAHALRLEYRLSTPHSDLGGAYPPVLASRSDRVRWSFGMADLFDGRHLEMWLPGNLPFDRFPVDLTVIVAGTGVAHRVVTNGELTHPAVNRWHLRFPPWSTVLSPMLELRPADELEHARGLVRLPHSGRTVTVDAWKPVGQPEDLAVAVTHIGAQLAVNERAFGPYPGDRFTCFFHGAAGGMEYAGATTTAPSALTHEVLHSWFARGVLPASDADGWWDEAVTTYLTSVAPVEPLDFRRPPVELCSRRPFQRHTAVAAYDEGSRLFRGVAALVGPKALQDSLRRLFTERRRSCLATAELEEHLVLTTGAVEIVDAFHRFVYGFDDDDRAVGVRFDELRASVTPDGRCRIDARISNDPDAAPCRHYLLLFMVLVPGGVAGPAVRRTAAVAGFDLVPGAVRDVRLTVDSSHDGTGNGLFATAGVFVVGAIHLRRRHPRGGPDDHRQRAMMRVRVTPAADVIGRRPVVSARGAPDPSPADPAWA